MIIGEHTRDNDLEVNVLKGKQLTNIRTTGKDEAVKLTPPIRMTLERRWPGSRTTSWSK
jgi:GTP-binding protein